ncbi:MAG: restriction endonuclease subunit S [Lentilactobacillus sunkii]|uniref:restriction endonuclease subunit S n=1 Tax=Lentilactobacillus sunkii TaxID=481719 RepID=UPI002F357974
MKTQLDAFLSVQKALSPCTWEQRKLSDLGSLQRGKSKHRPRNDPKLFQGSTPFIQTGDVASATLFLSKYHQTLSEFGVKQSKIWPAGTLVITIAANIADSTITTFDTAFPDSIIGFTTSSSDVIFVKEQLDFFSRKIKNTADTGTQANLNLQKLNELPFEIPSKLEQKKVGTLLSLIEHIIAANQGQSIPQLTLPFNVNKMT